MDVRVSRNILREVAPVLEDHLRRVLRPALPRPSHHRPPSLLQDSPHLRRKRTNRDASTTIPKSHEGATDAPEPPKIHIEDWSRIGFQLTSLVSLDLLGLTNAHRRRLLFPTLINLKSLAISDSPLDTFKAETLDALGDSLSHAEPDVHGPVRDPERNAHRDRADLKAASSTPPAIALYPPALRARQSSLFRNGRRAGEVGGGRPRRACVSYDGFRLEVQVDEVLGDSRSLVGLVAPLYSSHRNSACTFSRTTPSSMPHIGSECPRCLHDDRNTNEKVRECTSIGME